MVDGGNIGAGLISGGRCAVDVRDVGFEQAVRTVLGDYLAAEGFADPTTARTGGVIFHDGVVMLRFRRADPDSFDVQVSVGQRRTSDIVDWVRVARLSPEASIAQACWSWELPEQPSLEAALARLRADVLAPHVAAFWRDPRRLAPVFEEQDREHERRFRAGREQHNLRAARESFQHGRFQEAEQYFDRLDRLSDSDQTRRDIAHEAAQRDRRDPEPGTSGT